MTCRNTKCIDAGMTKKKNDPMPVVPFRLPAELVRRLDRYAERLRKEQPGLRATRTDAVRVLLTEALDRKEADHAKS